MFPRQLSVWAVHSYDVRISKDQRAIIWKRRPLIRGGFEDHAELMHDVLLLDESNPYAIKRTVEAHGAMWLCKHGLPFDHAQQKISPIGFAGMEAYDPKKCHPFGYDESTNSFVEKTAVFRDLPKNEEFAEPIEAWLNLAKVCRAFQSVLKKIRSADFEELEAHIREWAREAEKQGITYGSLDPEGLWLEQFERLTRMASDYLFTGGSRANFYLNSDLKVMTEDSNPNVISEIGRQMLRMVLDMGKLAECSICSRIYTREGRIPKTNQHNYCSLDCTRAGNTRRKQEERAKRIKA